MYLKLSLRIVLRLENRLVKLPRAGHVPRVALDRSRRRLLVQKNRNTFEDRVLPPAP
jgi:hypothetical protein